MVGHQADVHARIRRLRILLLIVHLDLVNIVGLLEHAGHMLDPLVEAVESNLADLIRPTRDDECLADLDALRLPIDETFACAHANALVLLATTRWSTAFR